MYSKFTYPYFSYEEMKTWRHLSTGSEYPNSPCGMTDTLVYAVKDVTCPRCKFSLIKSAKRTLAILESNEKDQDSQQDTPLP